jgi:hypothetical protein
MAALSFDDVTKMAASDVTDMMPSLYQQSSVGEVPH